MRILTALLAITLTLAANNAMAANQSVKTKPDGKIVFAAALSGVTRIAIRGEDRVKELWSNNSSYEAQVNEDTGDMYLRYVGTGKPQNEDGFLVTEKGHTINYTLRPANSSSETVLIGLSVPEPKSSTLAPKTAQFATTTSSSTGGYTNGIVACVRQIYAQYLDGRKPPRARHGATIRSVNGNGCRAKIKVAAAGGQGGTVQAQSFYRNGVIAVFVDTPRLAPQGRSWVLVVEGK